MQNNPDNINVTRCVIPMHLTPNEQRILSILFRYRGSIQMYITKFLYKKNNITYSNEKYVYGLLSKLRKKSLVTYKPVRYLEKDLFLYYLTPRGLEYIKGLLDIDVGVNGTGTLPHNDETTYWDIPYEFYKPPLKQVDHFLMTQEAYQQIETEQKLIMNYGVTYKTSHYSSISFIYKGENMKLRPDSMIYIGNNSIALEVDRSTEWSKQLIDKFNRYKNYFNYCVERNLPLPFDSILFVAQSGLPPRAYKRRWTTIRSAFKEVFGEDYNGVDLMLYPVNCIKELPLQFEIETYYKNRELAINNTEKVKVTILQDRD